MNSDLKSLCNECFPLYQAYKCCVTHAMTLKQKKKMNNEENIKNNLNKPGVKDDKEKLRYDLLPWKALNGLVKVLTFGAKKYSPEGWRSVPNATNRYEAALLRHLYALKRGERIDPDSGLRHIDHMVANVIFLSELTDD